MEKWKDIRGYTGRYQISNKGRVKSFFRNKERILTPGLGNRKYYYVNLCKNGKHVTFKIHRLVAKYFVANPHNKKYVNHKNGNKLNNNDWNLEWVTKSENTLHAYKTGLKKSLNGESNGRSKLTKKDVLKIRKLKHLSNLILSKMFKVSDTLIKYIQRNVLWKHLK